MSEQEITSFTVSDRRAGGSPEPDSETAPPTENEPLADPVLTPSDTAEETTTEDFSSNEMPDPAFLLTLATMQMDTQTLVKTLMGVFDGHAWRSLGLIVDPRTGEPQKDLPSAQLAIDCVHFLLGKVESSLTDEERRDAQRRLNDLRMNYLVKTRE